MQNSDFDKNSTIFSKNLTTQTIFSEKTTTMIMITISLTYPGKDLSFANIFLFGWTNWRWKGFDGKSIDLMSIAIQFSIKKAIPKNRKYFLLSPIRLQIQSLKTNKLYISYWIMPLQVSMNFFNGMLLINSFLESLILWNDGEKINVW